MGAALCTAAAGATFGQIYEVGRVLSKWSYRNFGYVKNINHHFAELKRQEKYLCDKEKEIKEELHRNKIKMEMKPSCQTWLKEVEKMKGDITRLETEYENIHGRKFCCSLCPFRDLLQLGKQIVKKTAEASSLKNDIDPTDIMSTKKPARFIKRHAENLGELASLHKHVEKLKEWLRNEELKRICIWGPPGMGKTTIMENVHDAVGESGPFDIIFWITVRDHPNVRDVQKELLKRLYIEAENDTNDQRAHVISEELKDKRYVLFLDEVSSEINFKKIGIHDEHRHGKVVFACRHRNDCVQANDHIKVSRLSDEDAQKLFWEIVGSHLKDKQDIKIVAKRIIDVCSGIPNMIKLIGNNLANENDPAIWRNKLRQLRSPSKEPKQELEEVYKFLKLECDNLDLIKRSCFLYLAIFPSGYELHKDYVIECWRAEQFFRHFEKLGEARDSGHAILNDFVKKCLLEKRRKVTHYKMFELFRRVALRLAKHYDNSKEWEPPSRISLICNLQLRSLPEMPDRSKMLTLFFQKSSLENFPMSFFVRMDRLQLLDLHKTMIRLLPTSISNLVNLKALFLNNCSQLMQLPAEVGGLCTLEILDIRHTGILCLPIEIGQLTNLKCLKVSFIKNVGNHNHVEAEQRHMISSNIIARLRSLEELSIDVDPTDGRWNANVEIIVKEVAALEELTTLCFYFPTENCLKTFIDASIWWNRNNTLAEETKFRSFNIHVGYHQRSIGPSEFDFFECSATKHLRFSGGERFPDAILNILEQTCAFELIGHHDATNLCANNLNGLEACIIDDCRQMTSIIDGDQTQGVAFQHLNKLHINNLPNLVHIWNGRIESESLIRLTTLTLKQCPSLRSLFSQGIALRLSQLHYLHVEDCCAIEKIIEAGSIIVSGIFPKLKNLELIHLPRLSNICSDVSFTWDALKTIKIDLCEGLSFSSTFENAANLKVVYYTERLWSQLVWPNDSVRERFRRLYRPI